jgi:hypothetical protein
MLIGYAGNVRPESEIIPTLKKPERLNLILSRRGIGISQE